MSDPSTIIREFSQKYIAAVEKEQAVRDSAFISDIDVIGTIKVHTLTPKLFSILVLMKSPLVVGGEITAEKVLTFLWTIKIKESTDNQQEFFEQTLSTEDFDEIMADAQEYFTSAFADAPMGEGSAGVPYYSSMAVLVDYLASEYGWTDEMIINLPYKRLFQYMRVIAKRNDPKKILCNKSDDVKSELMAQFNPK